MAISDKDRNSYPINIKDDSHIMFVARKYAFVPPTDGSQAGIEIKSAAWECALYVPAGITESVQSNWGVEGVLPSVAAGEAAKLADNITLDSLTGVILTSVTAAAAEKAGKAAGALNILGGVAFAPNEMAVFRGMRNKNLQFTFEMSPSSVKEAIQIRQIVNRFKLTSQPLYRTETSGTMPLLEVPHIFNIQVNPKIHEEQTGKVRYTKDSHPALVNFDAMALTDFSVNYGGGSQVALFHEDGSPLVTTLTLNFQSIRPAFRNSTDMNLPDEDLLSSMRTGKEGDK